jgi:hypothetical protein
VADPCRSVGGRHAHVATCARSAPRCQPPARPRQMTGRARSVVANSSRLPVSGGRPGFPRPATPTPRSLGCCVVRWNPPGVEAAPAVCL